MTGPRLMQSMDRANKKNTEKVEKKLTQTANRIKKTRKKLDSIKKEEEEFKEIKKLLEDSDDEKSNLTPSTPDVIASQPEKAVIPLTPPGIVIFKDENIFFLFDEQRLVLKDFLKSGDKCFILGKNISTLTEKAFRNIIYHNITGSLLPDEEKCHSVSLYVFYLLSVHKDPRFVTACFEFLKFRRFKISAEEILPVLVNYGASLDVLCYSSFQLPHQFRRNGQKEATESFPIFNMDMVAKFLLYYVNLDLLKIDSNLQGLIRALTKITLDPRVRSSCLLASYSTLVSALCTKAADVHDVHEVASWLHLSEEHIFNQTEICRIVLQPILPQLHQALVLRTVKFIFKSNSFNAKLPFEINDVKNLLIEIKKRPLNVLEIYCLLHLIISTLPTVTATVEDSRQVSLLLHGLEGQVMDTKDSTDLIRVKLDIGKLLSLVMNKINHRFSVNLSPRKKFRSSS